MPCSLNAGHATRFQRFSTPPPYLTAHLPTKDGLRLPLGERGIATAVRRVGAGPDDVALEQYTVNKNNVLVQLEAVDSKVQDERRIGFRAGSEERP